jgi:hypothetical protein
MLLCDRKPTLVATTSRPFGSPASIRKLLSGSLPRRLTDLGLVHHKNTLGLRFHKSRCLIHERSILGKGTSRPSLRLWNSSRIGDGICSSTSRNHLLDQNPSPKSSDGAPVTWTRQGSSPIAITRSAASCVGTRCKWLILVRAARTCWSMASSLISPPSI